MQAIDTNSIWTRARAMFARAVAMIGDAAAMRLRSFETPAAAALSFVAHVAALPLLTRARRRELMAWLAPLEHVVRKLLFAEAAALIAAERANAQRGPRIVHVPLHTWTAGLQTRTLKPVAKKSASEDARSKIDRAQPQTWRAPFSFALPRNTRLVSNARAPRIRALWGAYTPPPEPERAPRVLNPDDSPFRLARRFEALRRVLEDPAPHAARLARALAREAQRQTRLVQRYLWAPCRTNDYDRDDPRLSLDAMGAAFEAENAFSDTS